MAVTLITGIGSAAPVALGRAGHLVHASARNPDRSLEVRTIADKEQLPTWATRSGESSRDKAGN